MRGLKITAGLVRLFIQLPIWFYLMYFVLQASHPDRLVMFLFYTYFPLNIVLSITEMVVDKLADKKP